MNKFQELVNEEVARRVAPVVQVEYCCNTTARDPCRNKALNGHIMCDNCRRSYAGIDLRHYPYVGHGERLLERKKA